jgi:DNA topoisomerase-3
LKAAGRPNKRIFNNAQISDHFAIIPTTTEPKNLDEMEGKVYDMIARRFVAAFFPAAEFDVTTRISTVARAHEFKTEGKVLTVPGWLSVYGRTTVDDGAADSKALPAFVAGRQRPGENDFRGAAPRNHEATAALHGSDVALRHGRRRQTRRRREYG